VHVEVHGYAACTWCQKAKEWLADHGIPFTFLAYETRAERVAICDRLGLTGDRRKMPQVIVYQGEGDPGTLVGGYREMVDWDFDA
jgi:glutaredoxin